MKNCLYSHLYLHLQNIFTLKSPPHLKLPIEKPGN